MQVVERILVATDFSPASDDALMTAAGVAKSFGSTVYLLHVIPEDVEASPDERGEIESRVAKRLRDRAERLRNKGVQVVETEIAQGVVFDQIDQYANQQDVNAILIGAGKLVEGGQFYLGTTAGRLRRKAVKPVWIVLPGASPQIDHILCPVDLSSASQRALRNAIHLARGFHAQLTVLTVIQSLASYYDEPVDAESAAHHQDFAAQKRLHDLDRFLREFDFFEVDWRKVVRRGNPQREIVKLAREVNADLLVMGSVGRTGVSRILIGGVARKVAQQMPSSIITVRSEEPIRLHFECEVAEADANFCAGRTPEMSCSRLEHGQELLEQGFPEEALVHFQDCTAAFDLCPHAWECMATAHERLGHHVASEKCNERAQYLHEILASNQLVTDIRENHVLFRTIFGI